MTDRVGATSGTGNHRDRASGGRDPQELRALRAELDARGECLTNLDACKDESERELAPHHQAADRCRLAW